MVLLASPKHNHLLVFLLICLAMNFYYTPHRYVQLGLTWDLTLFIISLLISHEI